MGLHICEDPEAAWIRSCVEEQDAQQREWERLEDVETERAMARAEVLGEAEAPWPWYADPPCEVQEPETVPPEETVYTPSDRVKTQIEKCFVYHPPKGDQGDRYVALRDSAKALAEEIATKTPESREQSVALTKLEECVMFANAAIARNE